MRSVQFAIIFCLGMHGSMARAGELEDQQTDDKQRETVKKLLKKYEAVQRGPDMPGLRIAKDLLAELDHRQNKRATILWQRVEITGPLRIPLTPEQLAELGLFIDAFGAMKEGQIARGLLAEHEKLVQESSAAVVLEELQLKSEDDVLTMEQLEGLVKLEKLFPGTTSASIAKRYLNKHVSRELQKDLGDAGLLVPFKVEQLADQRLQKAIQNDIRGGAKWLQWLLRRELAEIVEDYPRTKASVQAKRRLNALDLEDKQEAVANRIAAEQARGIREYWDTVYPSRTQVPVVLQK